jgi:hypothetical protein
MVEKIKMKRAGNCVSKKQIVRLSTDSHENHRGDFTTCPHCEHRMSSEDWELAAVELVLEPHCYKSGCVSIFSECPKCFEKSWTHERMAMFDCNEAWPSDWIKAVKKESERVLLLVLREWGRCICHKCKHLRSGTVEFHAWRECVLGSGPAQISCDRFKPLLPKD